MEISVNATSGSTLSTDHIKVQLFDYLCDFGLDIDGCPANEVIARIKAMRPVFDVDSVIDLAYEEGITFTEALAILEDRYSSM